MGDYEKLGVFYLGRQYDAKAKKADGALLYDSKDLVTHAVCVGMTGSGKTGLCVSLLEEAAIDGIPALISRLNFVYREHCAHRLKRPFTQYSRNGLSCMSIASTRLRS